MGLLTGLLDAVNSSLKADAIDRVTNTGLGLRVVEHA